LRPDHDHRTGERLSDTAPAGEFHAKDRGPRGPREQEWGTRRADRLRWTVTASRHDPRHGSSTSSTPGRLQGSEGVPAVLAERPLPAGTSGAGPWEQNVEHVVDEPGGHVRNVIESNDRMWRATQPEPL
jgi:hypothetical protein